MTELTITVSLRDLKAVLAWAEAAHDEYVWGLRAPSLNPEVLNAVDRLRLEVDSND